MKISKLINSLSKAEKRYFKMYSQLGTKGSKPKYVRLFELIEKTSNCTDEILLSKGFKATDKSFLNEKILESLHNFNAYKSVDAELNLLLSYFPILLQKNLFDEMRKRIRKAKQLATKYEKFLILLQIIQWEKQLLLQSMEKDYYQSFLDLLENEKEIEEKLNKQLAYENLKTQISMLRNKDVKLSKPEHKFVFQKLTETPLLEDDVSLNSITTKANYYHIKSIYHYYKKETTKAYQYGDKLIESFEKNPFLLKENLFLYKKGICLFSEICFLSRNLEKIPSLLKILKSLPFMPDVEQMEIFNTAYFYSLLYYITKLDYENGKALIDEIEAHWDIHIVCLKEGRQLAYLYNIMIFYSCFSEWEMADKWLQKILNFKRSEMRKDIQIVARIWQLVIGLELDIYNLENHIQKAYKYLNRNKHYSEKEKIILQFFRDLYKLNTGTEKNLCTASMYQELIDYLTNKKDVVGQLGLEELCFWAESKIQDCKMSDILLDEQKTQIEKIAS